MRTIKAKANSLDNKQAWQDIQQMQKQKKEHKQFRRQRQNRKSIWQATE